MNCLILGGAGFLGSHLCDGLLAAGHTVRIFDQINVDGCNVEHLAGRIEIWQGDFSDGSQYDKILAGVDVVYHLISSTVPTTANRNPVFDIVTNVAGAVNFLEAAVRSGIKRVIFFSSGGTVYGVPPVIPIKEECPTNPICAYGIGKLAVEKYLQMYHFLHGLDYIILRISNPHGARQRLSASQGVVAAFLARALARKPIEIWGDGSAVRDYIFVLDAIEAAISALDYGGAFKTFNIGTGTGRSLIDVVDAIEYTVGFRPEIKHIAGSTLHVPANVLDVGLAHRELGWMPTTSFLSGLEQTMRAMLKAENDIVEAVPKPNTAVRLLESLPRLHRRVG